MKALTSKVLTMRHLFRQWRLLRYIDKRIETERPPGPIKWGEDHRLYAQDVANDYALLKGIEPAYAASLLSSCIDNHFVGQMNDMGGTHIWVDNKDGRPFLATFSGLILGELSLLSPVWLLATGAAAAVAIIAAVKW